MPITPAAALKAFNVAILLLLYNPVHVMRRGSTVYGTTRPKKCGYPPGDVYIRTIVRA